MKRIFYFIFLFAVLSAVAADSDKKIIKWDDDRPKVEIKASGRFSKLRASEQKNSSLAPAGTTAGILAVDGYRFDWRPSWTFIGLGGSLLPFVHQSPDQSTLGIVETLPQKDAPESSIIVFMNLYNFKIINYTVMPGKNILRFCFIPNSRNIVCLEKQPLDKYFPTPKYQLLTVNTRTAETVSASAVFKKEITALCCAPDGNRLFVAVAGSDDLRLYQVEDFKKPFTTIKTVKSPIALNCSADGRRLVVTGSDEIQIYLFGEELIPEKTIKLPPDYHPDKTVLCSDDASTLLLSCLGDDTWYYNGRTFIKICKRTDTDATWSITDKRIIVGLPKKSTICIYDSANLEKPINEFYFRKTRPQTTGKLRKIICLPGKNAGLLILDQLGALSHFKIGRKYWQKKIIINQPVP